MTSLIVATGNLLSTSASIVSGIRLVSHHVKTILCPDIHELDRKRLLSVHKRIQCLSAPLNVCILLSYKQDSCVAETISYCREVINSATAWLESLKFIKSPSKPRTKVLDEESSRQLDHILEELNFVCNAVQMAAGMLKLPQSTDLSATSLIRAIKSITEMKGKTGDLQTVQGSLFIKSSNKWKEVPAQLKIQIYSTYSISLFYESQCETLAIDAPIGLGSTRSEIDPEANPDLPLLCWESTSNDPDLFIVSDPKRIHLFQGTRTNGKRPDRCFRPVEYSCMNILYLCRLCGFEANGGSIIDATDEVLAALLDVKLYS